MPTAHLRQPPWLLLLGLIAGLAPPLAGHQSPHEREFTAVYARFSEAYRKADPEMVAKLYTEDAFYLQPGGDVLRGRAAILGVFRQFLGPIREKGEPGPAIYFEILERSVSGDRGWDVGYYRMGPPGADSAATRRGGKFIVLWRKDRDGQWRIHADGYSGLGSP